MKKAITWVLPDETILLDAEALRDYPDLKRETNQNLYTRIFEAGIQALKSKKQDISPK